MRFNVIGRDQVFTHHPMVMWPSNTQPYDITLGTFLKRGQTQAQELEEEAKRRRRQKYIHSGFTGLRSYPGNVSNK